MSRIPLTVVGGYLGAGKTTLINRILTGDHGRRVAVIVNDFGDVSIDESLIVGAEGGVRALANGCVCCSAVDGLASALADIVALDPAPEHLVLEVSGVGDPWAVAQWGRTPGYELDGVVVVVDPLSIRTWVDDHYVGDTVRNQIAGADLVMVSHADDAPGACVEVGEWLTTGMGVPVLVGTDVSLALLLGRRREEIGGGGGHADHVATSFVPGPVKRAELRAWLAAAPSPVVRVKGFVSSDEGLLTAQRFGKRVEVVRARSDVAPVMSIVCRGTELTADVWRWCALAGAS